MPRKLTYAIVFLGLAIAFTALTVSKKRHGAEFIDGRYFVLAAQMFAGGRSPYAIDGLQGQLQRVARTNSGADNPELALPIAGYAYPPASLILYGPLGFLDYPLAKQLLNLGNLLLMPVAAWLTVLFFWGQQGPSSFWEAVTPALALGVGMLHFSYAVTITLGQIAIIAFTGLVGALLAIERRSLVLVALCAGIAAIKPQMTLLPILAMLIRERAVRESLVVLGAIAVTNVAAILVVFHEGMLAEMMEAVLHYRSLEVNRTSNTYGGLFLGSQFSALAAMNPLIIAAGLGAILWSAYHRNKYPRHTTVVAALLVTLYAMPLHHYDFVLILPVLLGCLTLNRFLGALLLVLAAGVGREAVTEAIAASVGAPAVTHQALHAVYVLVAFVSIQVYIFLQPLRRRGGSAPE